MATCWQPGDKDGCRRGSRHRSAAANLRSEMRQNKEKEQVVFHRKTDMLSADARCPMPDAFGRASLVVQTS